MTLPSPGIVIDQTTLKNARLAVSGTFTVSNYVFIVTGGNITAMAGTATTDTSVTVALGSLNIPGDNKYDQTLMSQIGPNHAVELGFGRVDMSNNISSETEGLRTYFNKLHRYKTASPDFQVGRKVCNRSSYECVSESCFNSMPGVVGMNNIDLVRVADLPAEPDMAYDGDQAYSAAHGPYLFYFKGSGAPGFGVGGKAVFWTGFQSHWGYWYYAAGSNSRNQMVSRLSEDSYTLSFTWSIWDLRYFYHRMGMGLDVGDMMRVSMNNTAGATGNYSYISMNGTGDDGALFMNQMGDPTLRLFMFAPPSNLSVVSSGGNPLLSWTASPDATVTGYHVYRAASADGPFTRLTATPVAQTTYVDTSVASGTWNYMVRATRLETSGCGTFYNASLGVQQAIDLTNGPSLLSVSTGTLPNANWNVPYAATLATQGGTPPVIWTLDSGVLPPGLILASTGTISGSPIAAGTSSFTVRATDYLNQTVLKTLSIACNSNRLFTLTPEAGAYTDKAQHARNQGDYEAELIAATGNGFETFFRYDLSNLTLNNNFVRATLILNVTANTTAGCYAILQAALTADAGDNWIEAGTGSLCYDNKPADNPSIPPVSSLTAPVAGTPLNLDVTPFVVETLAHDPAKKLGLRLFTQAPQQIEISSQHAYGTAQPRLVIETTDAPAIVITSPAVNPAAILPGCALQISATVTAIPARAGSVTLQWTQVSGSGTVVFTSPTQAATGAIFSKPGDYVIRLSADDGVLQSYEDITVRVLQVPDATTAATGPTDSLVLRLPLDEKSGTTANDVSGVSPANSGALSTGSSTSLPTWSPAGGKIGGALMCSGSGQQVVVSDTSTNPNPLDGMSQMSISFWMNPTALPTSSSLYSSPICKRIKSGTGESYSMSFRGGTVPLAMSFSVNGKALTSATYFANAKWYHVVMVFDATSAMNLKLYVNGAPDKFGTIYSSGTIPQATVPRFNTSPLHIGAFDSSDVVGFNGLLDEVRIYNKALSLAEVQDLYGGSPSNMGPKINLGSTVSGSAGIPFTLAAAVTDDGLGSGPLTFGWSTVAGPGSAFFDNPGSSTTNATCSLSGSFTLRLVANDGSIATFADVKATVTGQSFASWASGLSLSGPNASLSASPAGDGVSNLMKYALGLNPNQFCIKPTDGTNPGLPLVGTDATYLTLIYQKDTAKTDISYLVEAGTDMTSWSNSNVTEVTTGTNGTILTIKASAPKGSNSREFIRLKVTK